MNLLDYNLLKSQIELKEKEIKLKSQQLELNKQEIKLMKKNKIPQKNTLKFTSHDKELQQYLHETEKIKNKRKKIAKNNQIQLDKDIKTFSYLIHNPSKQKSIDMTIYSQLLQQQLE